MTTKPSLLDPEKVANEPDFFNTKARAEGAVTQSGKPLNTNTQANANAVIEALQTVEDPEIPINLYDLGLIYDVQYGAYGAVHIVMTLTAPNCPVAGELPKWVADAVVAVPSVGVCTVTLTWEPKWTKDMMSEDAKFALIDIF